MSVLTKPHGLKCRFCKCIHKAKNIVKVDYIIQRLYVSVSNKAPVIVVEGETWHSPGPGGELKNEKKRLLTNLVGSYRERFTHLQPGK